MNTASAERLIDLRFPAHADRMALVRPSVQRAAEACGFDTEQAQDIVLAVAEACQNVIVHAYAERNAGDILLDLRRADDGIIITVTDFAPAIDQDSVRPRDLDDVRPGGLGTHFLNELMDTVEFLPPPEGTGNVLQMTKRTGTAK